MNNSKYVAVIQAGGKGTRMVSLTHDQIPKPMLELNGKPMIQWQIENVAKYGIKEFVIIIGHLGEKIKEYFGNGSSFGVSIRYIEEKEPLGSAGALYYLNEFYSDRDYILIFGDVMFCIDWNRIISFHEKHMGDATLLAHPNAHPYDSDLLILAENEEVIGIDSKNNKRDYWYSNCVNAGIYILSEKFVNTIQELKKTDLEKDLLAPLMGTGKVYGYITPEYVKDVGTPERFANACIEQKAGVWEEKCLEKKQKCIFLDRDGTINKQVGLVYKDEQLVLEECASEAIKLINQSGYLAIVITNQPVVARGLCDISDVEYIHKKMESILGNDGAYVDDIAFCPHHPDKGYPEENPAYKIVCECRKPKTGMIDRMVKKYNIDLSKSYMIGDTTQDIQTGINAGVKTILVKTGEGGQDKKYYVEPDFVADNLLEAVKQIVGE
ncbi:D,D-heptose 1,7-bisphosphate phosphatase [Pseudobutyrivibrio sp. YE44]|uniref:HAD-IIIA family hydrolase n=1 Tax=Pseudobutyrivibrio sp. YE44 TaxID=1520802 RepID=UPI000887D4FB|nr:HAD-IIIA family hydrolase [Pseudobutyrivibrio sp. YE44]SDB29040.1 D,D-heptose 1,7-bisphosphate phosphatase [Pseudobutyrivibrio sp. YE44]